MHFQLEQRFSARPAAVAKAYGEAALYALFAEHLTASRPEFLNRRKDGKLLRMEVRYAFTGSLSAAARRVVDPAKLTWVERSVHDPVGRVVTFELVPDHYGDRFRSSGRSVFIDAGAAGGTRRITEGDLSVRVPLVAGAVERAIVSGLAAHLAAEVPLVERYVAG